MSSTAPENEKQEEKVFIFSLAYFADKTVTIVTEDFWDDFGGDEDGGEMEYSHTYSGLEIESIKGTQCTFKPNTHTHTRCDKHLNTRQSSGYSCQRWALGLFSY